MPWIWQGLLGGSLGEDALEVLAGEAPTAVGLFAVQASQGWERGAQPEQAEAADGVGGAGADLADQELEGRLGTPTMLW